MSTTLPTIDLSTLTVGQGGVITLDSIKQVAPSNPHDAIQDAHLRMYNDSGTTLEVWTDTGDINEYIPAGGWITLTLDQSTNQVHYQVVNILTNAPITLLMSTYYKQGEDVPDMPQLGNSPIGGSVATTGGTPGVANQLINTGNPASSTPVIQIAEAGSTGNQMFADNQGNLQIAQYVSSVLTTLFRIIAGAANNSDNVLISDAQHFAHVLGQLYIDKNIIGSAANASYANLPGGVVVPIPAPGVGGLTGMDVQGPFGTAGWNAFRALFAGGDQNVYSFIADGSGVTSGGPGNVGLRTVGKIPVGLDYSSAIVSTGNGSAGGTLELYTPIWGASFKCAWIYMRGFNTASNIAVIFPSAVSSGIIFPGDIGGSTTCQLFNGGTAQGVRQGVYATTGGTAGTSSAQSFIHSQGFYTFLTTADRFVVNTTGGSGINNGVFLLGF